MSAPIDFSGLLSALESDAQIKESIKEATKLVEKELLVLTTIINQIHTVSNEQTPALLAKLTPHIPSLRTALSNLSTKVPANMFYRYQNSFNNSLQSSAFIILLRDYLLTDSLTTRDAVSVELGLSTSSATSEDEEVGFGLRTEEYLHAVISLLNELSRLAVNRVTSGDFEAPVVFAKFAKDLSSAFGVLNLKNDSLRKRFDGIKYDVKKLEEIVYDLSLRGLLKSSPSAPLEGQGPTKRARTDDGPSAE